MEKEISLLLTPLQQGILFQTHYEENRALYHNRTIIDLCEAVHYPFMQLAVQQVVDHYEALRSSFSLSESVALVHPKVKMRLTRADYSHLSEAAQKKRIEQYFFQDERNSFNLEKPPLIRFRLVQLGEKKFQLLITYHHIIFGGNCAVAMIRDLLTYYDILLGRPFSPPPPLDDCTRYISALKAFNFEEAKPYWQNLLGSYSEPCRLPENLEKFAEQTLSHSSLSFSLAHNSEKIKTFCRSQRITPNLFFDLAWGLLLQYYCDKDQVVFGITKEFPQKDTGNQGGLFFNTLPISLHFAENVSIKQLIEQLKEQHHKISDYIYTPLYKIKALTSLSPLENLFYSVIDFKIYSPNAYLLLHYSDWEDNRNVRFESPTEYPVLIEIYGEKIGFFGRITYQSKSFSSDFIEQIARHYQHIVHELICLDVNTLLADISPLTAAEKNILLQDWSGADCLSVEQPSDDLFSLFEQTALKYPDRIALVDKTKELTYRMMYQQINTLADQLMDLGINQVNTRIIFCLPRCHLFSLILMALKKLRATYIPVDPEIPEARMAFIIQDCQPVAIISTLVLLEKLQKILPKNIQQIAIENLKEKPVTAVNNSRTLPAPTVKHIAHIMYTSGSTGTPKGVIISEQALVAFLIAIQKNLQLKSHHTFLATTAFTFDISMVELLLPFTVGASCVIAEEDAIKDAQIISELVQGYKIDCMQGTPSYWQLLLSNSFTPSNGMKLLCGGESMPTSLAQELMQNKVTLWQVYGPTETTVWSTISEIKKSDSFKNYLPIGRPLSNTSVYVLNRVKKPMPVGVPGDLYIGGLSLAEGYLNRDELNEKCFISDPFNPRKGSRLYKTGDKASWSEEGLLYYRGRVDNQIKLRGYRIELDEISQVLKQHSEIKEVITVLSHKSPSPQLVTYYTAIKSVNAQVLKQIAINYLPAYMVPAHIIYLSQIPMTPHGKINFDLLSVPEVTTPSSATLSSSYAEKIRQIWADVLQMPAANIHWQDDFFEIGGDSITATLVVARLSKQVNRKLFIKTLFAYSTLEKLYYYLQGAGLEFAELSPIQKAPVMKSYPLSYEQQRLWFIQQMAPESTVYTMFVAFSLIGQLNLQALQRAFSKLIERHSILRTRVITESGNVLQVIDPVKVEPMEIHPAQNLSEQALRDYAYALAQQPFDLVQEWPIRVHLMQQNHQQHSLLISLHHIAADGWSMGILTWELAELYGYYMEVKNAALPSAPLQYVDFAVWQQEYSQSAMHEHLVYWSQQLQQLPILSLPFDEQRQDNLSYRGERISFAINAELTKHLVKLSMGQHCTLFMTLLAAFTVLLHKYSGQADFAVGIPVSGRQHPNVDNIVGLFVNLLAIRQYFEKDLDFLTLLKQTKETLLEAFTHQDAPFEKVVENSHVARHLNMHPLCQVFFVMQDLQMEADLKLDNITTQRLFSDNESLLLADYETAKFDLTFYMRQGENGLEGLVEFNADLFHADTIHEWIRRYQYLLEEVVSQPKQFIDYLTLYSPSEKIQEYFFPIVQEPLPYQSIVEGFEQQVALYPDKIALRYQEQSLSYTQVNEQANQLANYLLEQFGPQSFIGICLERSMDFVISILAVLKMGAAYVPIDLQYPLTRISYILGDANIRLLLTKFSDLSTRLMDEFRSKSITFFFWTSYQKQLKNNPFLIFV